MPKIVIMAGGTGGHVFPGIAVAQALEKLDWDIEWFGTADKMEAQAVPNAGYPIHFLPVKGVRGKGKIGKLLSPFMLLQAVIQARTLLKEIQPDIVLGMGGYASGPGGIAAKLLGIPLVIHEQNAVFGMTNRVLAKIANRVLCGFDVLNSSFADSSPKNVEYIGNPVRQAFFETKSIQAFNKDQGFSVVILGGSLGALALNQIVPPVLNQLTSLYKLSVLHQAGKGKAVPVASAYLPSTHAQVTEFIDDIPSVMAHADLLICRAGALTVAEISSLGKPAIFVPLPIAVDDHQTYNARSLSEQGAALLIQQSELAEKLPSVLSQLFEHPDMLLTMATKSKAISKTNAAQKVARICADVIGL